MIRYIVVLLQAAVLAAFFVSAAQAGQGWLSGPAHGLHPHLKAGLYRLHRAFGRPIRITPHGGCRRHGNRRAPHSFHRIAAGCKAADIVMPGVARSAILRWWARHMGGGRGFYCGRPFVHVDVGPARTWRWYCGGTRIARRGVRRGRRF